jgi:hypothetical protein
MTDMTNHIKLSMEVIKLRESPNTGGDVLWRGASHRVPCIGERVTIPAKDGPRTYKVVDVTGDVGVELWTVEVVKIKDVFDR